MSYALYIHIPFCSKRCNYCDFYLITNLNVLEKFLLSLQKEIELYSETFRSDGGITFDTIYFGGGTPSILSARQLGQILNSLHKHFTIGNNPEVSIECNPEDFLSKSFEDYKSAGINRISFGVQSFKDSELKFLTRQHSAEDAENVIKECLIYFDNINLDIIYSLPQQTINDLDHTLSKAMSLDVKHISAYTLTFEKNTPLFKSLLEGKVSKNEDSNEAAMFEFVSHKLTSSGFDHYEVSNFARDDKKCRHNLKYWNYENYLGLGPSSHSMVNGIRWNNFRDLKKYNSLLDISELPVESKYELSLEQKKMEFIMLALRSNGINYEKYNQFFSEDFNKVYNTSISKLTREGFAADNGGKLKLTEKGYVVADEITARYF